MIHKAKKSNVNSCKALIDSAYEAVKYSIEVTKGEAAIFKQLDLGVFIIFMIEMLWVSQETVPYCYYNLKL
ncbi:MAG: hypothetical protein C7M88_08325 [Candidatus Arcticimaribacter sp.]|nr:MAG: hypothetical protein C7M88_08325 [Candidatus Arcticimaribacter sp.]PTM02369.1 MAG: hypothetical protein DA394_00950 [Candidatus Arcticimaribacter sp.]